MNARPLHVVQVFQPADGGLPDHVLRATEGLVARGHRLTVAGPADAALRPALEAVAAYVALPFVGAVPAPRADVAALRGLLSLLAGGRADVLHAHGQKGGILGRVAALRAGVPALYSPHSFVYRTHGARPRRGAAARARVALGVERALGRRSAAIVACAREERAAAVADGLAPADRVHVVYYGVAPDATVAPDPALLGFRGDGPLLGFVAGLRDQKGLPTLLDALELLAARGAAPRFAIVGNGPLQGEVARRVAGGPLAATTLLAPFAGRVEPYLLALDGFVLPSYWEGLPIAVLEAMALGLPVVATSVNGTPEAVSEGDTGYLVAPHDAVVLADRIGALATDPAGRARMGAAGRRVAAERFTIPRMVDELEALYRAVADGRPAG